MFKFLAKLIDEQVDDVLEQELGEKYNKTMNVIGIVFLCALLVVLLSIVNTFVSYKINPPQYNVFKDGKAVGTLPVLATPSLSAEKITGWSARLVRDVYGFNFRNINQRLNANSFYFTPEAFNDFKKDLEVTNFIDEVVEKRLFVNAVPTEEPVLVGRDRVMGRDVIRVQVPVVVTFIGGSVPEYRHLWIDLYILAVSTTESPEGLLLAKMKPSPAN